MKLRFAGLLSAVALTAAIFWNGRIMSAQEQSPKPPIAKKVPKTTQIHGYTVTDEYAWLADKTKTDKDMLAYLKAEEDYATTMMAGTKPFRTRCIQKCWRASKKLTRTFRTATANISITRAPNKENSIRFTAARKAV